MGTALRTAAPEDHLCLVDLESTVIGWGEARCDADRAIDIDHPPTIAANHVMVVVTGAILEARRRPGRLDAADQAPLGQDGQSVVHRLAGDDADLGPHGLDHIICRAMWSARHRREHRQALGGNLNTVAAEEVGRVVAHARSMTPRLD
ncbi:MAG TPA: hypothetical protein PLP31_02475 [Thermoanaerobaculaceae bacterium]|nr:hypothetical protein [Thermoanaerobaculaceae bacterium]